MFDYHRHNSDEWQEDCVVVVLHEVVNTRYFNKNLFSVCTLKNYGQIKTKQKQKQKN